MSLKQSFPAYGGRGPSDMRVGIAMGVITTIIMVLRVYVRLRINKFGTAALIWTLVSWGFTVLTQVFGILATLHGLGNHMNIIVHTGEMHNFLLFTWITVFFFNMAIPIGKVAVATFLIEMNAQGNLKIRRSLIAVAIVNIVVNIPQVVLVWFQCDPPNALWDPLQQDKCDYRRNAYYTYFVGAVAALSDFYFAIIPITMLIPLRIDRKLKWGLSFLMGLGLFAGVAAVIRSWAAKYVVSEDSSYGVGTLFLWGEIEEWLVLIAMSIPPIWPLFRPLVQGFIKTSTSQSRSRKYKPEYPYGSATGGSSGIPPRVTTTLSISSHTKNGTPLPSPRLPMSKYGDVLEEAMDGDDEHDDESQTVVSREAEETSKESRRKSLPMASIRNSIKLQDGWIELSEVKEHGRG